MIRRLIHHPAAWLLLLLLSRSGAAQQPGALMVEGEFITQELGAGSLLLNPGALSAMADDDGVMLHALANEDGEERHFAFAMSMGSLGFAVQEMPWSTGPEEVTLRIYRINLAVGGRVFAIGTSNKLYHLQYNHHFSRQFGIDAGFHFQPVSFLRLAAMALDANEPELDGRQVSRRYLAGAALLLFNRTLQLQGQSEFSDSTAEPEDLIWQAGVTLRPVGRLEIGVGYKREPDRPELFLARATLPLPIGIEIGAAVRSDKEWKAPLFAASLLLPLQTMRF